MRLTQAGADIRGSTAVEFGLTAPLFFMLIVGMMEFGILFWTQAGLQHGAEMAARCATVNTTLCGSATAIQNYAAQQSYGLNPPPSIFTVSDSACGNQISASYPFIFISNYFGVPSLTITALSCFPK